MSKNYWSAKEDSILVENYHKFSASNLQKNFFPSRTKSSVIHRLDRLGLTKCPNWTKEEDAILTNYWEMEGEDVIKRLPNRTLCAIYARATLLNVRYQINYWSTQDDQKLCTSYPIEDKSKIMELFPNRSWASIQNRAAILGVKRVVRKGHTYYVDKLSSINPTINIVGEIERASSSVLVKCKICEHEWYARPASLCRGQNPTGCPCCAHEVIGPNFKNSIWTSPYKYIFEDWLTQEQMQTVMPNSNKAIIGHCPNCNREKSFLPNTAIRNGKISCICGNGWSYPNKFLYSLLEQLKIEFEPEKVFSWAKNNRYDSYVPKFNLIIEIHGIQHFHPKYNFSYLGGKTLHEQQESDKYKETLAKENGIKHYISIDAAQSTLEYIRHSIENSSLSTLFDLSHIDWNECHKFACSNDLLKRAVALYQQGLGKKDICSKLRINSNTLIKWLNTAKEIGLVQSKIGGFFRTDWDTAPLKDYLAEYPRVGAEGIKHKIKKELNIDFSIVAIRAAASNRGLCLGCEIPVIWIISETEIKEFPSIIAICNELNLNDSDVTSCCKGKQHTVKGYTICYKKDYTFGMKPRQYRDQSSRNKKIKCIEKDIIFESVKMARQWLIETTGIKTDVVKAARLGCTAGGFHWQYVD